MRGLMSSCAALVFLCFGARSASMAEECKMRPRDRKNPPLLKRFPSIPNGLSEEERKSAGYPLFFEGRCEDLKKRNLRSKSRDNKKECTDLADQTCHYLLSCSSKPENRNGKGIYHSWDCNDTEAWVSAPLCSQKFDWCARMVKICLVSKPDKCVVAQVRDTSDPKTAHWEGNLKVFQELGYCNDEDKKKCYYSRAPDIRITIELSN